MTAAGNVELNENANGGEKVTKLKGLGVADDVHTL